MLTFLLGNLHTPTFRQEFSEKINSVFLLPNFIHRFLVDREGYK
jgi:hypothetical protein